ncbi:MAG TPA: GAF domain-containing protein [Candidatus Sulfotelmatobacter sp.]|nr:GAF domain-containing protein [Candidatus Sulfotelmatobacter sp.]
MARRDLDAALQLLADRAQYITGATGAAIALRRNGKNDMLCRASTGSNAPELGALLSTEFGLSGESVRTRQPLRCDDAERDERVNREVCRQLGIASVVVMPVVNDDGVLGVFELFSGRVNAFGERDLSAVQRLSEMVETAVRLAEAAEKLPDRLAEVGEIVVTPAQQARVQQAPVEQFEAVSGQAPAASQDQAPSEQVLEDMVLEGVVTPEEEVILEEPVAHPALEVHDAGKKDETSAKVAAAPATAKDARVTAAQVPLPSVAEFVATVEAVLTPHDPKAAVSTVGSANGIPPAVREQVAAAPAARETAVAAPAAAHVAGAEKVDAAAPVNSSLIEPASSKANVPAKKSSLFWSAAGNLTDAVKPGEADQSHVPPVLRSLQQCQACGFPVSTGRLLCVECEEKKWRGQLRVPQKQAAVPLPAVKTPSAEEPVLPPMVPPVVAGKPGPAQPVIAASANSAADAGAALEKDLKHLRQDALQGPAAAPGANSAGSAALQGLTQSASIASLGAPGISTANFVLSAGMESSQSWFAANKYILAVLLLVIMIVAGFLLLR